MEFFNITDYVEEGVFDIFLLSTHSCASIFLKCGSARIVYEIQYRGTGNSGKNLKTHRAFCVFFAFRAFCGIPAP